MNRWYVLQSELRSLVTAYFPSPAPAITQSISIGPYSFCTYQTDGTDDYVQWQAAINYLSNTYNGGIVYLVGNINLGNGDIVSQPNIETRGINFPIQNARTSPSLSGAQVTRVCITKTTGTGAITLTHVNAIKNIMFWYPNQNMNSAPIVYPPTIKIADNANQILIQRCNCGNAYWFIDANTPTSHDSLRVDQVYGSPLYRFALISNNGGGDTFILTDIWPQYMMSVPGNTLLSWIQENLIAFEINRADGIRFINCNIFSANSGYIFHGTARPEILEGQLDSVLNPITSDTSAYLINIDNTLIDNYRYIGSPQWPINVNAIHLAGGYGHTVRARVMRCGCNGIVVDGNAYGCIISNNLLGEIQKGANGVGRGILITGSNNIINNNTINGLSVAGSQGICINGSNNTVIGNIIDNIVNSALELQSGSAHNTIVGNNGKTTSGLLDSSGQINEIAHNYWT